MTKQLETREVDVLVVGSGAAGMCAAAVARLAGLEVLLVEKTEWIGGTTALSGGGTWIPLNRQGRALGVEDSRERVETYLDHLVGAFAPRALRQAFLDAGPAMLEYLEANTQVRFSGRQYSPDYWPDAPGAGMGGRALDPLEFDGRQLGEHFEYLRKPWPEFLAFGGMMVNKTDIDLLLQAKRSWRGFRHALKLLARFLGDRLRGYSRGTRLVLGNALAGRLYKSLLDLRVEIWRSAPVTALLTENGRVAGARLTHAGKAWTVRARRGVLLATGGFPANLQMREELLPHPTGQWSAGNEANEGDGLRMAMTLGARLGNATNANNAFYSPVSLMRRDDGSMARFPHLMLDRYKPGVIMVDAQGQRFVNEADSYHACGEAQYRTGAVPAWLVCDARFLHRYGLGMVRPQAASLRAFLDKGYLFKGDSLAGLARALGIEPAKLEASIERYNGHARQGQDPDFGKGQNVYNRYLGDPSAPGNPCLAPIEKGPFYAVQVVPGDIGTACGLLTDVHARVLDAGGAPIEGLYAAGNDMNSIMGGQYPGPGITLGPGLTFGYLAARHMAGAAEPMLQPPRAMADMS
ncbi:FAD-dependent oxidoreductase [Pseudomonas sp. RIT-PI-AD]|uniref:FAD-dependent oxidoreductase n=1 Tax=Pseudomonas sp. RIT-PI-AD TaxID=3035294 RepID=UPI0021DAED32|nr:FAD-dependent oxidoreductase [Pseudomonas sp. RIT-PI-AD]